ncbi:MAG: type II toxin-antitoxin system RelE/ParE family toxin [Oscillospiraceae bacterium]|nr:type II toxin-antitoxin system RelE/ParE family toxin [Oscillospiraceae bacterium]
MKEFEFKAIFYDKPDGSIPTKDFLKDLDPKMRAKMAWTISLLEAGGNNLREPYSKHLDDGIFELRAKVSTDISRVLYFFIVGKKAILTHGFIKKTDKTPPEEINKAKQYRDEYLNREESSK